MPISEVGETPRVSVGLRVSPRVSYTIRLGSKNLDNFTGHICMQVKYYTKFRKLGLRFADGASGVTWRCLVRGVCLRSLTFEFCRDARSELSGWNLPASPGNLGTLQNSIFWCGLVRFSALGAFSPAVGQSRLDLLGR